MSTFISDQMVSGFTKVDIRTVLVSTLGLSLTPSIYGAFFMAWLIKFFVIRYGGLDVDRKIKPIFMGMILGQILISILGVLNGFVMRFFV